MTRLMTLLATAAAFATPLHAQEITEFRIGLLGGENAQDRMASNECLRGYAEEALGVPVRLFTPADYNGVIQGLLGGSLDMAWLGASAYAAVYVADENAIEPVLVKTNLDGSYTYHSIGFARADSGITSVADMEGKTFAFADPNSTSGFLIPNVELPAEGYSMAEGEYFSRIGFSGGHEQSIIAVVNGDYDAGVTWADGQGAWEDGYNSGALRKAADSGIVDMNDIVEIWKSSPIPEGPVVLRQALPDDVKQTMIDLVAGLHEADPECAYGVAAGETAGFTPVTHEEYQTIIDIRRAEMN
ncbi:phosphonate ABC transporter substrate-binding protein [Paracoccus liaowanqingii]|uniref:Phosphonate ABC transporter substrate-binding protein n=1 Tax=Paracoccus liaowanqingii TaxID=2560053 RepID=A0A4Z1BNQ1_9RHOB|nr:phosphonate ABC transporter substrate-binding protein [Paracoccus liaowanqingii]TGN39097.1 phosphonate ABC transporter substrate-binding protein [Paracoccus liaowanqingii]